MPRLEFSAFEYMLLSYTGKYTAYKFILFTNCTSLFWFNIKISTHPLYKFLILNQNSYTELLLVNLYNEKYLTGISVVSFNAHVHFICLSVFYQWNSVPSLLFRVCLRDQRQILRISKTSRCVFWTRKYLAILHYYY